MKKQITTAAAPLLPGAPFSQAIAVNGFLYTSGFGPQDPETKKIEVESVEDQTRQTIRNLAAVLESEGLSLADVVKATVHLTDLANFAGFNSAYLELMPEPLPVRTTVQSGLGAGMLVEIDFVAAYPA